MNVRAFKKCAHQKFRTGLKFLLKVKQTKKAPRNNYVESLGQPWIISSRLQRLQPLANIFWNLSFYELLLETIIIALATSLHHSYKNASCILKASFVAIMKNICSNIHSKIVFIIYVIEHFQNIRGYKFALI